MEPTKENRDCTTCAHKAPTLDQAPMPCWDCSRSKSLPNWEPITFPHVTLPAPAQSVMDKQVGGAHYKEKGVFMQPWAIIKAWGLGFHRGNVLKYLLRAPQKNGKQDIEKAIHYLEYIRDNYDDLKEANLL